MTAFAAYSFVGALQFEIGWRVIEGLSIKLHDVGAAAIMVSVTGLTFGRRNIAALAMQTTFRSDVTRDVLVAFEAKPPLAFLVKRLVTTFAGLFEFGVPLDDVAGFD